MHNISDYLHFVSGNVTVPDYGMFDCEPLKNIKIEGPATHTKCLCDT